MKNNILKSVLLALVVGVGATYAQNTDAPATRPNGASQGAGGQRDRDQIHVPSNADLPTDVQGLVNQFRTGRDALLAERRALLASLGDASEEEVRAALEELRESHREELQAQRELARQLRKELRDLRRSRDGSGGGNGGGNGGG